MRTARLIWAEDSDLSYELGVNALEQALREHEITLDVTRAVDGNEAARLLDESTERFHLAIVDLDMPRFDGVKTIRSVGRRHRGLPIMVVSGKVDEGRYRNQLPRLVEDGLIVGWFSSGDRDGWLSAAVELLRLRPPSILHISDLHFGERSVLGDDLSASRLFEDATEAISREGVRSPDIVVISGDLSDTGHPDEFRQAACFIAELRRLLGIGAGALVVVPGNHDVYRRSPEEERLRPFSRLLRTAYSASDGPSLSVRYPYLPDDGQLTLDEVPADGDALLSMTVLPHHGVAIAGLNSVISQQDEMWDYGRVSTNQIRYVKRQFTALEGPSTGCLRIAVLHHHIFEVPSVFRHTLHPRTVFNQAHLLEALLECEVRLVFHGHMHYTATYEFCPRLLSDRTHDHHIFVCATGSLSAPQDQPGSRFGFTVTELGSAVAGRITRATQHSWALADDGPSWRVGPSIDMSWG